MMIAYPAIMRMTGLARTIRLIAFSVNVGGALDDIGHEAAGPFGLHAHHAAD
jgi:hypothetical protein